MSNSIKVKALLGFVISPGKIAEAGEIVELPPVFAAQVIHSRQAEAYVEPVAVEVESSKTASAPTPAAAPEQPAEAKTLKLSKPFKEISNA